MLPTLEAARPFRLLQRYVTCQELILAGWIVFAGTGWRVATGENSREAVHPVVAASNDSEVQSICS